MPRPDDSAFRSPRRWRTQLGIAVAVSLAVGSLLAQAPTADPFPLQRILVPDERIPLELEKAKTGRWLKMPLADWEAKLEQAKQADAARHRPPRLVKSSYAAELGDEALVNGRGQWTVANPGPGPALLALGSLSLAVNHVKWDDGREAVLGENDGKPLGLLLEKPGSSVCFFDWSARGKPTPAGLRFDLRFPEAALTTLELTLPVGVWLSTSSTRSLLSGPHESGAPLKRNWQVQLAGRLSVELTIHRLQDTAQGRPVVFAQIQGKHLLASERSQADYDFSLEAPGGGLREMVLEGDAELQPYEVTAKPAEVVDWRWETPPPRDPKTKQASQDMGKLTVRFRDPAQGAATTLRVRCLATHAPGEPWRCPALRPAQGLVRSETAKVQFQPDVHLAKLEPGDFQVADSQTEADGGFSLRLVHLAPDDPRSKRPRAHLDAQRVLLHATQRTRWQLGAEATLSTEIDYDLSRGKLFRFLVQLPASGFQLDSVETEPKELLRSYATAGPLLTVELAKGLTSRLDAKLKIRMHGNVSFPERGAALLSVPEIDPLDATSRVAKLDVSAEPNHQIELLDSTVAPSSPGSGAVGPQPSFSFAQRDRGFKGQVRLTAPQPLFRTVAKQDFELRKSNADLRFDLEIEPLVGALSHVDVRLSVPWDGAWQWKLDEAAPLLRRIERLHTREIAHRLLPLGCTNALQQVLVTQACQCGPVWRLHFAEPLRARTTVKLRAEIEPRVVDGSPLRRWDLPLLMPTAGERHHGEVAIQTKGIKLEKVTSTGFEGQEKAQLGSGPRNDAFLARWRTISAAESPRLHAWTADLPAAEPLDSASAKATTTIYLGAQAPPLHHWRFEVRGWQSSKFVFHLPAGARLLSASVNGKESPSLLRSPSDAGDRVTLAMLAGAELQRVEVLYQTDAVFAGMPGWGAVQSDDPRWPVQPLDIQRSLRVDPLLVLAQSGRCYRPAVPREIARLSTWQAWISWLWTWENRRLPEPLQREPSFDPEAKRQQLLAAESACRKQFGENTSLRDALAVFVLDHLKDSMPLVIDRGALSQSNLGPSSRLGSLADAAKPFWESLDLAVVVCPHGCLLTTRQRLAQWQAIQRDPVRLALALERPVQQAALEGSDATGAMVAFTRWLQQPGQDPEAAGSPELSFLAGEAWLPLPGGSVGPIVFAERSTLMGQVAALLAFAALANLLLLRGLQAQTGLRVSLLMAAGWGLAVVWLPVFWRESVAWPMMMLQSVFFGAAWIALLRAKKPAHRSGHSTMIKPVSVTAALLAVCILAPRGSDAQPGGTDQVFLLPDKGTGNVAVLVSQETWQKLDRLAARAAAWPDLVLVSSSFQGRVADTKAEIDAEFQFHSFAEKADLLLPLQGVLLKEGVFLDGAPVFPTAAKGGYSLPVRGKGTHHLRLSFTARVTATGEQRECRWQAPRVPQSRLDLRWSAPSFGVQLAASLGAVRFDNDPKQGPRLQAELGAEGGVQLRWRTGQAPTAGAVVDCHESYFWDLRAGSPALTGVVRYEVAKGSVERLAFQVPDHLHVRSVDVSAGSGKDSAVALKHWSVARRDGRQQLVVELAQPLGGRFQAMLEFAPQLALNGPAVSLDLPYPLQSKSGHGVLGYRLDGMDTFDKAQNLAVNAMTVDEFSKEWKKSGAKDPPSASRAFRFRRTSPQAKLGISRSMNTTKSACESTWTVGASFAELKMSFDLPDSNDPVVMIEGFVPKEVKITDVAGPLVQHWSLNGTTLQVWLPASRKRTQFEISAWMPWNPGKDAKARRFVPPTLRMLEGPASESSIRVESANGRPYDSEGVPKLVRVQPAAEGKYRVPSGASAGVFTQSVQPSATTLSTLHVLERDEDGIDWTCCVHVQSANRDLRTLPLMVDRFDVSRLRLEVPGGSSAKLVPASKANGQARWDIVLPRNRSSDFCLVLHGRLEWKPGQPLLLPQVRSPGAATGSNWLTTPDLDIDRKQNPALDVVAAWPERWRFLTRIGARFDRIWTLADDAAVLRLDPRGNRPSEALRVLWAAQDAWLTGLGTWMHQARFWIDTTGRNEVRLRLPAEARLVDATLDGRRVTAKPLSDNEHALEIEGGAKLHGLQVRWRYSPDSEPLAAPRLAAATLADAEGAAPLLDMQVPLGYRIGGMQPRADQEWERWLRWTSAQSAACRVLAKHQHRPETEKSEIREAQRRFFAGLRVLQHLAETPSAKDDEPPRARTLAALKQANAKDAQEGSYEPVLAGSEKNPAWDFKLPYPGEIPHAGSAVSLAPGAAVTDATLRSVSERRLGERRRVSEWLLLATVALWLATLFRRSVGFVRELWPELLALLVLFGFVLGGGSWIGLAMLALLVAARLWIVGAWLRRRLKHASGDPVRGASTV